MKKMMLSITGLGAGLLVLVAIGEPGILVRDDFEPNLGTGQFSEGAPIQLSEGWEVFSGAASVSVIDSWSGQQSLRLEAGEPVAHVVRLVPPPGDLQPRFWVEFRLRPAVAEEPGLTTISVFGAKLAFSRSSEEIEVWAYDGTAGQPVAANFADDFGAWVHLILEVDGQNWRLHSEKGPATEWLGLDATGSLAIHWFGDSVEDVFLDDLRIFAGGPENPFVEAESGQIPKPKDFADPNGEADTVPGEVALLRAGEGDGELSVQGAGFALQSGGSPAIIYVNGNTGSDLNDGESPSTAKATLTAGIAAVATGGVVVVAQFSAGYTPGTINPAGKSVTIRPSGSIIIR
jgi:hypothetical protein